MDEEEKVYSLDGEDFRFDDPEEAYQEAVSGGFIEEGERLSLYEGTKEPQKHSNFYSIQSFLEDMASQAYDEGGEYAQDYIEEIDALDTTELGTLIEAWFKENLPEPTFWLVSGSKQIWYDPKEAGEPPDPD